MKRRLRLTAAMLAAALILPLPAAHAEAPADCSAKAFLLMDAATGTVLAARDEDQKRSMASTTKIMTTLLVLETADLEQTVVATKEMVTVEGSGMGLKAGDQITYGDLCRGMMLASGNDAANTAAIALCGSLPAFADAMNRKAAAIGMTNTHFATPSGLDAQDHYSTARDMAILCAYALQNPAFCELAAMRQASVHFGQPPAPHTLTNHNRLLHSYPDCIGVKTGFTKKSGRCLVSAARRNGATLICVTLSDPDDWRDHAALLDYGFSKMESVTFQAGTLSLPIAGGQVSAITGSFGGMNLCIPAARKKDLRFSVRTQPFFCAPLSAGQVVGQAVAVLGGKVLARVPVTADRAVAALPPEAFARRWQKAVLRLLRLMT